VIRATAFYAGVAIMASVTVHWIWLSFANPDMTETRLLLTFWPVLVVGAAGTAAMAWGLGSVRR